MPGAGFGLVGGSMLAVFDAENQVLAQNIWRIVDEGGTVDDVLDAISSEGLRQLGSFALLMVDGDGLFAVLRGTGRIRLEDASGAVRELEPGVTRTWREVLFSDDCRRAVLSINGTAVEPSPYLATSGLFPAEALSSGSVTGSGGVTAEQQTPTSDPVVDESRTLPPSAWLAGNPGGAVVDGDAENGPAVSEIEHEAAFADSQLDPSDGSGAFPALPDGYDGYDYEEVWGRTSPRSVAAAAVDGEMSAGSATDGPGMITDVPGLSPEAPEELGWVDDQASVTHLHQRVGAPDSGAAPPSGDHDGMTISIDRLREMRDWPAEPQSPPAASSAGRVMGPTVQAVTCVAGHPNPPTANECRECGGPLGSAVVVIDRPSLGVLLLSTGQRIDLLQPVVIGRRPKIPDGVLTDMPTIVEIGHMEALSRSHAQFRLEGWQVLVEDLGSSNGTTVTALGRAPIRLRPREPVPLLDGATVDLGGELQATYLHRG